jgi:formylglycine-generating enzyme required for sulfatase activity
MNQFDQQLRVAKNKQKLLFLKLAILVLVGVLIVIAIVLFSRGTRIEIRPNEASISAKSVVDQGVAIIISDTLYSISSKPTISVSAEGFYSKKEQLDNNNFGKVMTIMLKPLPAKVQLSTNASDENTNWIINGTKITTAENFDYELEAGEYELIVSHPYYEEEVMQLRLARGEVFHKKLQLDLITSNININSKPDGGIVSINNIEKGITPLTLAMNGGNHQLTLNLADYETIVDTIEISRANLEANRDYRLELKKAELGLTLKPRGGELTLDGILIKNTDVLKVEAGIQHRLTYSKKGYFSKSHVFNVTAEETLQLSFNLKKEIGKVEVVSTPTAEVLLNNKVVGTTPLNLSLDAIEQTITITKPGYRSITKTVLPSSSGTKKISASLLLEKIARLKEAPAQYTNKAGGILKLFKPNDTFVMGAKRSESGQRANEFIKKVKLSKAFYAGVNEVTNAEYKLFDNTVQGNAKHPVTTISWLDAAAYCNWLSESEGLSVVYNIKNNRLQGVNPNTDGYRLLTEAEWEWLSRKAGKPRQTTFVWGDEQVLPKNAVNIADESAKGTVKIFVPRYNDGYAGIAPVASFSVEASGLYDQGGNVSEWTHDSYSIILPETGKVYEDPIGTAMGDLHVIKGSNWRSGSITELRPAFREGIKNARDDLGFRIGRYIYGGN